MSTNLLPEKPVYSRHPIKLSLLFVAGLAVFSLLYAMDYLFAGQDTVVNFLFGEGTIAGLAVIFLAFGFWVKDYEFYREFLRVRRLNRGASEIPYSAIYIETREARHSSVYEIVLVNTANGERIAVPNALLDSSTGLRLYDWIKPKTRSGGA